MHFKEFYQLFIIISYKIISEREPPKSPSDYATVRDINFVKIRWQNNNIRYIKNIWSWTWSEKYLKIGILE